MAAPKKPHALGRLIREVQQANGWSYADISANAQRAGRSLSRSRVESLRNDDLTSIGIKAIEALAAGLSVTPARVAAAAMESMGYRSAEPDASGSATLALENDPQLSAPVRRVLLAALDVAHEEFHQPSSAPHAGSKARQARLIAGNKLEDVAADEV